MKQSSSVVNRTTEMSVTERFHEPDGFSTRLCAIKCRAADNHTMQFLRTSGAVHAHDRLCCEGSVNTCIYAH